MTNYQSQKNPTKFPLISIIIPIYNAAPFLSETIQSAINQTYPNLEILLLDDGSTDSSSKICEQFTKQFKTNIAQKLNQPKNPAPDSSNIQYRRQICFYSLPHQGVSATRNHGLNKLSGEYFCFLDADDLLAPTFVAELFDFANQRHLKFVSSSYQRIVENYIPETLKANPAIRLDKNRQAQPRIFSKADFFSKLLDLESGYGFCHMKLIYHSLKNLRFDESLKVAEDALYNFAILKQVSQVGVLPKTLYFYRVHKDSTVRTFSTEYTKNYQTAMQTIQYYLSLNFPDSLSANQKQFQAFVASHLFLILTNFCCHQDNPSTIGSIKRLYRIPLFYRAIYLAPLRLFSPAKAVVLLCFKLRFFHLLKIIGKLRSKQNSKSV